MLYSYSTTAITWSFLRTLRSTLGKTPNNICGVITIRHCDNALSKTYFRVLVLLLVGQRDSYLDISNCMEEKNFLKRARSLLVIVASPPSPEKYEVFTSKVLDYTSKDPFKFKTPNVFTNVSYVKASTTVHLICSSLTVRS